MSGDLIVVTGPPGSGKSTVAELIVREFDPSALVPGDNFFEFLRTGRIDPWLPESDAQNDVVTRAAAAATGRLTDHCDVVYEGVIGPWFLDTFRELTGVQRLHYCVIMPPLEVCLARVRSRIGHGFTDLAATEHMWRQFDDAEIDDRFRIVDLPDDPGAVARSIIDRVRAGTARTPRWMRDVRP